MPVTDGFQATQAIRKLADPKKSHLPIIAMTAHALCVERFCKCGGGTPSEAEEAINALEHECIVLKAALNEHPLAADAAQSD
jgi:CheY-like chemotaxis protein